MADEELAIIGIGCRFPGATCLEEFWDVLRKGEDHVVDIPPERWNMDAYFDVDINAVGKSYASKAGLIKDVDHFDNKLFKINETEAAQMDPQQRQVLECTYMALEDAGITRQQIAGQKVGVYIGSMTRDYGELVCNTSQDISNHTVTGQASSILSNRVSYVYNLTGPSMTIDTACSSSFVAIHQAGLALRAGDCAAAICGGVNLLLHPEYFIKLSKSQMLSPTGHCHAFSANADGYTRGEGCGIVIVKLLSQAFHDGDKIWGTIVTGLNQDGRQVTPITAPSGKQQEELLNDVYTRHGIDPTEVDYIEAHGTGTKRGDPIEATALGTFFEKYPRQRHMGSVKTNIGHLESAAGVAGLIKVLLMMKHNTIVSSLHFDKPNEEIDFDRFQFVVPTENTAWKRSEKVACVNSFGFGGSNSHVIIKSFTMEASNMRDISLPICFSGSSENTLNKSMSRFIGSNRSSGFSCFAYTSCMAREHFPFRKAFFANSFSSLKSQIEDEFEKRSQPSRPGKENIVFVFCGMGTAWEGMCNDLITKNDQFKERMLEIDKSLSRFVQWSLMKRLLECDDVDDPLFGPIAIFACQVSLAHLWETWGVKPAAVVGQSVGEVAAAHVAGILSLDEAVRVIYHRTRILAEATGGKMMLVRNVQTEQVETVCRKYQGMVDVALYYSPVSCTVSGDEKSVLSVKENLNHLSGGNALFHELPVTSAFHSPSMDSAQVHLDEVLCNIKTSKMTSKFVSTVDLDIDESTIMSKSYWGLNVRNPVRFCDAIKSTAQTHKMNIFVEIGPRTVLKTHLQDIFRDSTLSVTSIPSLRVKASYSDVLQSLLLLYDYGVNVKWDTFFPDKMQTTSSPSYVFDSKPLLLVSESVQEELKGRERSQGDHLFLKGSIETGSVSLVLDPQRFKSVFEHTVKGAIILPGVVYAEAALALARMITIYHQCVISVSVTFRSPFNLKSGTVTNLDIEQSNTMGDSSILGTFLIKKGRTVQAEATIKHTTVDDTPYRVDLGPINERCKHYITGQEVYQNLEKSGFSYGEMMSIISSSQTAEKESLTLLEVGPQLQAEARNTILHPAVLDGMLQAFATVTPVMKDILPYSLEHLTVKRKTDRKMFVHLKVLHETELYICYTLSLLTSDGYVIAHIGKLTLKVMGKDTFDVRNVAYTIGSVVIEPDHETEFDKKANLLVFSDEVSLSRSAMYPLAVHDISTLHNNGYVPDLLQSSGIVVMFQAKPRVVENGKEVERELEEKTMPLVSLILNMSQHAIKSPLLIVTLTSPLDYKHPDRRCHVRACIHESIRAFIRCVRREFPKLLVKSLDLNTGNMNQYDANEIMTAILKVLKVKDRAEFESLNGNIYEQKFEKEPISTPSFRLDRKTNNLDTVLYSTSSEEISQPFFTRSRNMEERGKDDILLSAHCVAVHSKFLSEQVLYPVENGGYMGIRKGNPVVTFESTGFAYSGSRRKMYIACYPQQVRYEYYVPMKFALNVKHLGGHFETGDMLKLYCLWRLCGGCSMKDVVILYSEQTREYAEVMKIILLSRQTKTVSLLTPEEIPNHKGHHVLISTTQITTELAQQIVLVWRCLEHLISLEKLLSVKVIHLLNSVKPRLKVATVRTHELLAFNQMNEHIPKLYSWIKKSYQNVTKIGVCFKDCKDIAQKLQSAPINIAEILETREFRFQENNRVTTNQLKIPEIHLFDRCGMYLVVGGMTGLGWECVLYLASKGAGCITIISRRKPDPSKQVEMKHVSQMHGCIVTSQSADVQDIKEIGSVLKKLETCFPAYTLKGVFFGAAVLKDALLLEMRRGNFRTASSPKVAGSWNLHILTDHLSLEYFVLFSSVVSIFGNAGQTNYGAGNGFMDALAHVRRQNGKCGQTVNWGPLNMGMMQERHIKQMESFGFVLIHKRSIPDCLTHILMLNMPQIIMCGLQLVKFGQSLQRETNVELESRFRSVLSPFRAAMASASPSNVETFDFEEMKKMSKENALAKLVRYVKAVVIDVAMLDESSLDVEQGTRDQGVDSMNFMQITGKIMDDTHVQLSSTKLNVENASVTQISQYIYDDWMTKVNCDKKHESLPVDYPLESDPILLPGEQFTFDNYMRDPNHISHLMIVKVELPDVLEPTSVKKILRENVKRHPICRTTFHDVNGEARKSILSAETDIDYRICDSTNHSDVTRLTEERFYLDRQGPIRFVFVKGSPPHLVIVFHRIGFDHQGITILLNDLVNIGQAFSKGQSLSDVQSAPDVPIGPVIRTILQPKYEAIKRFWIKTLETVPYVSFADKMGSSPPQMDSIIETRFVSADQYQKLKSFTDKEGLSLFKCLVGLVQLLWSTRANGQKFAMSTYVDQRIFSPKLTASVGRGVNFTPLSCEVRDDDKLTVVAFLRENSTMLEKCTENGIFPYGDLKRFLPQDHYHNVMTSFVTFGTDEMRNMGKGNDMRGDFSATSQVKALFGPNTELYFDILNRKMSQTIAVVLYARKDCFTEKRIHMILNAFWGLLEDTVANPQITVRTLQSKPYITQLQDKTLANYQCVKL